jgi:hypothetical protein
MLTEAHPQDAALWSCPAKIYSDSPAVQSLQELGAQLWEKAWKTGNTRRELRKQWGRKVINAKYPGSTAYGQPRLGEYDFLAGKELQNYPSYLGYSMHKAVPQDEKERVRMYKYFDQYFRANVTQQLTGVDGDLMTASDMDAIMHEVLECRYSQEFHYKIWEFGANMAIEAGNNIRVHRRFAYVMCGNGQVKVGLYWNSATAIRSGYFPNTEAYDFFSNLLVDNFYRTLSEQCTRLPGLEEETSTTETELEVDHEWTDGYAARREAAGLPN